MMYFLINAFFESKNRVQGKRGESVSVIKGTELKPILDSIYEKHKTYFSINRYERVVKPPSDDNGRLLWHALGAQTTALIHEHIHVAGINHDMEEMVLDADVIENLMNKKNPKEAERIVKILIGRFKKNPGDPKFKALGERLEALRDKAEQGLISSVEFIKQLCELAKDTPTRPK